VCRTLIAALLAVLAITWNAAAVEDPHGAGYDGRDWRSMAEDAKLAYIAGFLAGSAAAQAVDLHRKNPKLSVDAAVAQILAQHSGTFPFTVNVYKNRLDDYYFDPNNRRDKIYQALLRETTTLRKSSGSP
jgi:hypothetical protein